MLELIDNFQGLILDCISCPECGLEISKFDPLMYLTLPFPATLEYKLNILVMPLNCSKRIPVLYHIKSQKSLGLNGVFSELSKKCNIDANFLYLVEIYQNKFYQIIDKTRILDQLDDDDTIVAYEINNFENLQKIWKEENYNEKDNVGENQIQDQEKIGNEKGGEGIDDENENEIKIEKEKEKEKEKENENEIKSENENRIVNEKQNKIIKEQEKKVKIVNENFQENKNQNLTIKKEFKGDNGNENENENEIKIEIENENENEIKSEKENENEKDENEKEKENENEKDENDLKIPIYYYRFEENEWNRIGIPDLKTFNLDENTILDYQKIYIICESYFNVIISDYYEEIMQELNIEIQENEINPKKKSFFLSFLKSSYEKQINSFGFESERLDPLFQIITTENLDYDIINTTEIKKESIILIHEKIQFGIRINPYLFQIIENFENSFSRFENHISYTNSEIEKEKQQFETITLENCLNAFLKEEKLSTENMWYCPKCRKHVQAIKKIEFWKLPNILIIHLKRFEDNGYTRKKITSLVDFPLYLDMSGLISSKKNGESSQNANFYELSSVSNHYGTVGMGHYTAIAKNNTTKNWYYFDDKDVYPVTEEDSIQSEAAYVLFYIRKKKPKKEKLDEYIKMNLSKTFNK
ncbi:hypothetical protein M0812_13824 [Anaeramoeba flamelloides]|uniref:USP domain-containing protein n=1 Tax=Anaeramoeba flamelloides TaxID=1746091 RepID=A0AAV7ZJC3_9EUKA|nr:hypothetical protein M0812_13824 [Anaeramoeba flamelloides]